MSAESILTRAELDALRCSDCGVKHDAKTHAGPGIVAKLGGTCHPEAGIAAYYARETGQLVLACARCGSLGARIQVAWAVPS